MALASGTDHIQGPSGGTVGSCSVVGNAWKEAGSSPERRFDMNEGVDTAIKVKGLILAAQMCWSHLMTLVLDIKILAGGRARVSSEIGGEDSHRARFEPTAFVVDA